MYMHQNTIEIGATRSYHKCKKCSQVFTTYARLREHSKIHSRVAWVFWKSRLKKELRAWNKLVHLAESRSTTGSIDVTSIDHASDRCVVTVIRVFRSRVSWSDTSAFTLEKSPTNATSAIAPLTRRDRCRFTCSNTRVWNRTCVSSARRPSHREETCAHTFL